MQAGERILETRAPRPRLLLASAAALGVAVCAAVWAYLEYAMGARASHLALALATILFAVAVTILTAFRGTFAFRSFQEPRPLPSRCAEFGRSRPEGVATKLRRAARRSRLQPRRAGAAAASFAREPSARRASRDRVAPRRAPAHAGWSPAAPLRSASRQRHRGGPCFVSRRRQLGGDPRADAGLRGGSRLQPHLHARRMLRVRVPRGALAARLSLPPLDVRRVGRRRRREWSCEPAAARAAARRRRRRAARGGRRLRQAHRAPRRVNRRARARGSNPVP
jgi:hypothetical protein